MNCAVLFSGGKDSVFSAYKAKKQGYKLTCLISIFSSNKDSYMFHTPSITKVKKQAEVMEVPIIIQKTEGKKEEELKDLENAIKKAIEKYSIKAVVTGAVESVYQSSRIQKICDKHNILCFNPLWKKDPEKYWKELLENNFEIIITAVAAEGLSKEWLGEKIDNSSLNKLKLIEKKYRIHLLFEGGEAETFVLNCPLFKRGLKIINKKITGSKNSWRMEIEVK